MEHEAVPLRTQSLRAVLSHGMRVAAALAPNPAWSRHATIGGAIFGVLLLGGCTTLSPDGGFGAVSTLSKARLGHEAVWARTPDEEAALRDTVRDLLAAPLTADSAAQIALINNRGLQATYAQVGIAEADLVQASRLPNPGFYFSHTRAGDVTRIERTFTLEFVSLLTVPLAMRIQDRYFAQAQLLVANEVVRVAGETRKAFVNAVAAAQSVRYLEQVQMAADAGADLAQRMAKAGNWSKLDEAREQVFQSDASAQLARARQTAVVEREKLTRLLGLSGNEIRYKLPDRLPDLPKMRIGPASLEQLALDQRLDIQAMKLETEGLASSLGLTRATRLVNVLEVGYRNNSDTGYPAERGYQLSLEIPLFDWGDARVAKAEATYMQAVNRLAETATNAQSEVRESYAVYTTAYDQARQYRDVVVPLRKKISDEYLLRYNGMLVSVFELLADAREQIASVNAYINALKEFWVAEADLQRAVGGKAPPAALAKEDVPSPTAVATKSGSPAQVPVRGD